MAKVPNGVETLPKISIVWVGCTNVTDDRQTTDRLTTTYFTFANKTAIDGNEVLEVEHQSRYTVCIHMYSYAWDTNRVVFQATLGTLLMCWYANPSMCCFVIVIQVVDSSSDTRRNIRRGDLAKLRWHGAHTSTLRLSEWLQYNPQVYHRFSWSLRWTESWRSWSASNPLGLC